jgi:hypothetical protein
MIVPSPQAFRSDFLTVVSLDQALAAHFNSLGGKPWHLDRSVLLLNAIRYYNQCVGRNIGVRK